MAAIIQDAIMLFGDSLTQRGWEPGSICQRLAAVYARKMDVINRGFSGYNTNCAIPVLEQCLSTRDRSQVQRVRLLTIWFGTNDACLDFSPQHVPFDRFTSNIRHLVQMVKSPASSWYSQHTCVILITPPPIHTALREAELAARNPPEELDRDFNVTRRYAEAVKYIGQQEGVPVTDLWTAMYEAAGRDERSLEKFLSDGVHLTTEGHSVVYDALMKTIAEHYPELHYENLPFVFAPWYEIDWKNPAPGLGKRLLG